MVIKKCRIILTFMISMLLAAILVGCAQDEMADIPEISEESDIETVSYENTTVSFYDCTEISGHTPKSIALSNQILYYTCFDETELKSKLYYIDVSILSADRSEQIKPEGCETAFSVGANIRSIFTGINQELYILGSSLQTDGRPSRYLLYQCDSKGQLIETMDITQILADSLSLAEEEIPGFAGAVWDASGYLYLKEDSEQKNIWVLDTRKKAVKKLNSENDILDMAAGKDGNIYAISAENQNRILLRLDGEKGQIEKLLELPGVMGVNSFVQSEDGVLYLSGSSSLYLTDISSKSYKEYLSWTSIGISGYDIESAFVSGSKDIFAVTKERGSGSNRKLAVITPISAAEETGKETVLLGSRRISDELKKMIAGFNMSNSRYQLETIEYLYEDVDRMAMDLLVGKGPDLIDIDDIYVEEFTGKGILEDLKPYLEASRTLSSSDLVENVLKLNTVNDVLTCIPPAFIIETVLGRTSQVGEKAGWTNDAFRNFILKYEGAEIYGGIVYGQSKEQIVYTELMALPDKYVDWNTHTAYFNTPIFIELLELANGYRSDHVQDTASIDVQIQEGNVLLYNFGIWNVHDYLLQKAFYGEDVTFIGYPTESGSPCYGIRNMEAFGINSGSTVKEGAWEFIEYLVTSQKGTDSIQDAFPTLNSALQEMYEEGLQKEGYLNENHEFVPIPKKIYTGSSGDTINVYAATQEEVKEIDYFIDSAVYVIKMTSQIERIVWEEVEALFSGQKSAEETAEIIQNRAQLYMDESKK